MLSTTNTNESSQASRLPPPCRDENQVVTSLLQSVNPSLPWPEVLKRARPWVDSVRKNPAPFWAMESLLREYPISSSEGLALMRLAEALLRVPDTQTAIALTTDQLSRAQFDGNQGDANSPHKLLASLSATAIALSKKFLPDDQAGRPAGLIQRLGSQTVVAATIRAIGLMGRQFVLGRDIREAMSEAASARGQQSMLRFSYDMLGEGARTESDAARYLASYKQAIESIAGGQAASNPKASDGISIKLSALFSRYEESHRDRVFAELVPRVWSLIEIAAPANINLTIDAEESDRLELSLDVIDHLAARISTTFPTWFGFGLAVQAYQTRALEVVHEVARIGKRHGLGLMVRLVKGAYWDGEIKRAQELGLAGYPVFSHKHHTDTSYLACAQALLSYAPAKGGAVTAGMIFPQFATHNAGTIAAILHMAEQRGADFEMQRLHGMGEGVYRELMRNHQVPLRVYAPVGEHRDLLAYLVRRLLENGANSSFVHQLTDESVDIDLLLSSPLSLAEEPGVPPPLAMFAQRRNSVGLDLSNLSERLPILNAVNATSVPVVTEASPSAVNEAMEQLQRGIAAWAATPVAQRAAILRRAADALEMQTPEYCGLLVKEAHKTLGDCIPEVREAVDFLRYYAEQAENLISEFGESGPQGLGVFVCISPWNFPLAIFVGQVAAALVTGNTVAAKPAEQTPAIAQKMVALLHEAGVPRDALVLLHGPGETVGAALVAHPATQGVCFTGSTAVAQIIHRSLANKNSGISPPALIAETGGINAMLVDSSALPEQVVDAVVQSAFRSAGQRCSALRLLCVHESIADSVIQMVRGALLELSVGDPALFSTDVGPLIDGEAFDGVRAHIARLRREARWAGEAPMTSNAPRLVAPIAFELDRISAIGQEIFGPVLHIVRWSGEPEEVIAQINALGYGLTMGLQTRIDSRAMRLAQCARVGNVYVNRNMIGAVVGVQPFGGEGLSGTGPKAGGPHYLLRFCRDGSQSVSAGGQTLTAAGVDRNAPSTLSADMEVLRKGQTQWSSQPLEARLGMLERAIGLLPSSLPIPSGSAHIVNAWKAVARQAKKRLDVQTLPGPTGERNELHLHGRGVFALLVSDSSRPHVVAQQLAAALVAGNAVALMGPEAPWIKEVVNALQKAGAGRDVLVVMPLAAAGLTALLQYPELAGVALDNAADITWASRQLASRSGPILPLIVGGVDQGDTFSDLGVGRLLLRFVAEQTLTINTAAAGGNVDLLARAAVAG